MANLAAEIYKAARTAMQDIADLVVIRVGSRTFTGTPMPPSALASMDEGGAMRSVLIKGGRFLVSELPATIPGAGDAISVRQPDGKFTQATLQAPIPQQSGQTIVMRWVEVENG